jgi:predicted ester cyclase
MSKSTTSFICTLASLCLFIFTASAQSETSAAARNKATTQKSYDAFNNHQLDALSTMYASDFVDRTNPAVKGPEGVKAEFMNNYKIWPDVKVRVEQIVAEGDWVMARCVTWATQTSEIMGVKPTNKKVEVGYWSSHRYNKDGLIVESWSLLDQRLHLTVG